MLIFQICLISRTSRFSKVFNSIEHFDDQKGSLKSWIRRICVNTTIDVLKKEAKWEPSWNTIEHIPNDQLQTNQFDTDYLLQLIEQLPAEQRFIFNLYEIEGYSHEEIAELLDINVNSCRVYLSRAKKKLRSSLQKLQGV